MVPTNSVLSILLRCLVCNDGRLRYIYIYMLCNYMCTHVDMCTCVHVYEYSTSITLLSYCKVVEGHMAVT